MDFVTLLCARPSTDAGLTFVIIFYIFFLVWGCTGFDGCGNACTASECEGALN